MSQQYNHNSKRPKPQDTQLGILKLYIFPENSALGPWESAVGVTCPSMRLHLKSCRNFI